MAGPRGPGTDGVPLFHVHRGHAFEGFELVERSGRRPLLVARCDCGGTLGVAEARFVGCPECRGRAQSCRRCGGSGLVVDHAALRWQIADPDQPAST